MNNMLDYAVYIGRFQPYHLGHDTTISEALNRAKNVIVVIGSHKSPRTIKNPFTSAERAAMILDSLTRFKDRIHFLYVEDRLYSDTSWVKTVEAAVMKKIADMTQKDPKKYKIGIIGHKKDRETANYVNMFRQWEELTTGCYNVGEGQPLNATKIRELIFSGHWTLIRPAVSDAVYKFIQEFVKTEAYAMLKHEYDDGIKYERMYENAPFGSTNFYTADAVVIQSGHVLLVQRKHAPGKGLWALPGGHVGQTETAEEAAIRELMEETNINVQKDVIRRCIFLEKLFDHPERSLRARISNKKARTVSVAYGIKLDDKFDLPRVRAGDDAEKAWWFSFAEVEAMRDQLFEDHADIIAYFLDRV